MILTLLLHSFSDKAMEEAGKVALPTYHQDECYISQEQPDNNMLSHLFHLHATPSCDMSHTDGVHVPGNKSVLWVIAFFYKHHRLSQSPPPAARQYSPILSSDPVSHYIYGLRKIVI